MGDFIPEWNNYYATELKFHLPCHCFQYKKQITIACKKLNISSRLANPELQFSSRMKHHFSPQNRNFSFIPGWKQKIPFTLKIIFIKVKILKLSSWDETSNINVKFPTRQTELKLHPGMKNLHIISPLIHLVCSHLISTGQVQFKIESGKCFKTNNFFFGGFLNVHKIYFWSR